MIQTYTFSGTVTDAQTLHLNEPLPVSAGPVRVTVEIVDVRKPKWQSILDRLEVNRAALGAQSTPVEEIDAYIAEMKAARED